MDNLHCPYIYEVIVPHRRGLGSARNDGADIALAKLLVFLDDDIAVHPLFWRDVFILEKKVLRMLCLGYTPCSRAMVVLKEDFQSLGGFDSSISYTGEDVDFYFRAVDAGFEFHPIPSYYIHHLDHPHRETVSHRMGIQFIGEQACLMHRYNRRYKPYQDYFFCVDRWQEVFWTVIRWLQFYKWWFSFR